MYLVDKQGAAQLFSNGARVGMFVGAYQGYPPRNDYRPEGFQSYSNGYSNGSTFNKRGGGSAGAARGNSMRGGGRCPFCSVVNVQGLSASMSLVNNFSNLFSYDLGMLPLFTDFGLGLGVNSLAALTDR